MKGKAEASSGAAPGQAWTSRRGVLAGGVQHWVEVWCGSADTGRWVHVDPVGQLVDKCAPRGSSCVFSLLDRRCACGWRGVRLVLAHSAAAHLHVTVALYSSVSVQQLLRGHYAECCVQSRLAR